MKLVINLKYLQYLILTGIDLKKTSSRLGVGKANPKLREKLPSDQFK